MQRRFPNPIYNDPFLPSPPLQHENQKQYGYQQTHNNNARRDRNQRISGRSRGRRSNDSVPFMPSPSYEKNLLERLRNERIRNVVQVTLKPLLKVTDFPRGFLENALLPCIPSEKAGILVAGVLLYAAKKKGTDEVGKLWRKSQLRWRDLFGTDFKDVQNFIEKNKLEFTISPPKSADVLLGPERSITEMKNISKIVIDEFLHNYNIQDTCLCITEVASPSTVHVFISIAINEVIKGCAFRSTHSSVKINYLGQLLATLQKRNWITFEQYKAGLTSVLESLDDYVQDTSFLCEVLGVILEPLIEDTHWPPVFLKELLQPCIPSETAGLIVSSVLHRYEKRKGAVKVREFWGKSGLQWTDILGADSNVKEFIKTQKLEFIVIPTKIESQTESEKEKQSFLQILKINTSNKAIYSHIKTKIWLPKCPESTFIRPLVLAVHENAISGTNCNLNKTLLNNRMPLLKDCINNNVHFELQALYALQSLMERLGHPHGLLQEIFQILYDADVIQKETFRTWESSFDPKESAGKAAAVRSVNMFLKGLVEADSGKEHDAQRKNETPPLVKDEDRCLVS